MFSVTTSNKNTLYRRLRQLLFFSSFLLGPGFSFQLHVEKSVSLIVRGKFFLGTERGRRCAEQTLGTGRSRQPQTRYKRRRGEMASGPGAIVFSLASAAAAAAPGLLLQAAS